MIRVCLYNGDYVGTGIFCKGSLDASMRLAFLGGFYEAPGSFMKQCVYVSKYSVQIQSVVLSGNDMTNNFVLAVFYR